MQRLANSKCILQALSEQLTFIYITSVILTTILVFHYSVNPLPVNREKSRF